MTNFENKKEFSGIAADALKSTIQALREIQQTPQVKEHIKYLENIVNMWHEDERAKEMTTSKPIERGKAVTYFEANDPHIKAEYALKHWIRMLENELNKAKNEHNEIFKAFLKSYKQLGQLIDWDKKSDMQKADKEYQLLKKKMGYCEEDKCKEEVLSGKFNPLNGGKMGAKKIATQIMDEGGLIDKNGRLKYHSAKGEPDYKTKHKALSNKIQRWLTSKKQKNI